MYRIGLLPVLVLSVLAGTTAAQTVWWGKAPATSSSYDLRDVTIAIAGGYGGYTSDPLGGNTVATPSTSISSGSTAAYDGGIVVDKILGVYWYTDGVQNGSSEYTLYPANIPSHICAGNAGLTSIKVTLGSGSEINGSPTIKGLAYERRDSGLTEQDRMWALFDDPDEGWTVGVISAPDRVATTTAIGASFRLRDGNGDTISFRLTDIAWDCTVTDTYPEGFLWAIDLDGTVYRWAIDSTLASGSNWNLLKSATISGGSDPFYEGITLDKSRPMTLPGTGWGTATASGTVMGLDTNSGSDTVTRTLTGPSISQETLVVGSSQTAGLTLGLTYSAEPVRTGAVCSAGTSCFGSASRRIDVQYNNLLSASNVCSLNPIQPLIDKCPGTQSVDLEWCTPTHANGLTPYLLRSSALSPAGIGAGGSCTADPDLTTATTTAGTNPLTITAPSATLTADSRSVEYVQWVFMCGGTSVSYSATGDLQVSDSFRIAWSNP